MTNTKKVHVPLTSFLACGLLVWGSARAQGSVGESIPLGSVAQFVTVQVSLNGSAPLTFAVDTGASGALYVSPEVMRALKLPQTGTIANSDPSGRGATNLPTVQVDSLSIGRTQFGRISAVVGGRLPGVGVDGVIGLKAFQGMTVSFDFPRGELHFSRVPLPDNLKHTLPYRMTPAGPEIEVYAAGKRIQVTLDSGGPGVLNVPGTRAVSLAGELQLIGRGRTASGEFEVRGAPLDGTLDVAGWKTEHPLVQVVPQLPLNSLGYEFLRHYEVTFDTLNHRVAFNH